MIASGRMAPRVFNVSTSDSPLETLEPEALIEIASAPSRLAAISKLVRVRVEASANLSSVRGASLILFCVKTTDNAATARELARLLTSEATVLTMQNGVDNVEQIRNAAGIEALPAVVYVAASVPEPGQVKHVGRGDLVLGPECDRVKRVADIFARAKVS